MCLPLTAHHLSFFAQGIHEQMIRNWCASIMGMGGLGKFSISPYLGYEIDEEGNVILIVKNSWGHKWGIHGYIFLKGGTSYRRGVLGVNLDVLYPIVCDYITPLTLELSKMARVYTRYPDILSSSPPQILTPADFPQKVITPDGVPEYTFAECEEWRLPVPGPAE